MLGREVGAALTALPGPGMALFERYLVVPAVARPDLEHALDVHLHDVGPAQAVLGLEELGEDGVVEGLRAQQADRQGQAARRLPALRAFITAGIEAWQLMPDQGDALGAGRDRLRRPGCWPSRCSGIPPRPGPRPGCGPAGHRLPGRPVAFEDHTRAASIRSCSSPHTRIADTRPPSWPAAGSRDRWPGPARCPRRPGHLIGQPAPARRGTCRSRSPSPGSAGTPGCSWYIPSAVAAVGGPAVLLDLERLVDPVLVVVAKTSWGQAITHPAQPVHSPDVTTSCTARPTAASREARRPQ